MNYPSKKYIAKNLNIDLIKAGIIRKLMQGKINPENFNTVRKWVNECYHRPNDIDVHIKLKKGVGLQEHTDIWDTIEYGFPDKIKGKKIDITVDTGTEQGMGIERGKGVLLYKAKTGKQVYHGSPYKFDRFDIEKIGTGEGAQAFGHGKILHHGTDEVFDQFDENYIKHFGFHFGTPEQATTFGKHLKKVDVNIKNPLRLDDLGTWNYQNVIREARQKGIKITEKEYDKIFNSFDENKALRDLLEKKGYDGIVYENMVEGTGDSYIAFKPEQLKIIKE